MSIAACWIVAILVFVLGLSAAALIVFGGAISTVACMQVPPDWVYYIVIFVGVLVLGAAAVTSILIIRGARAIKAAAPVMLGVLLMCVGLVAYFGLLGRYC